MVCHPPPPCLTLLANCSDLWLYQSLSSRCSMPKIWWPPAIPHTAAIWPWRPSFAAACPWRRWTSSCWMFRTSIRPTSWSGSRIMLRRLFAIFRHVVSRWRPPLSETRRPFRSFSSGLESNLRPCSVGRPSSTGIQVSKEFSLTLLHCRIFYSKVRFNKKWVISTVFRWFRSYLEPFH